MKLLDWLFERGSIDPCNDDELTREVRALSDDADDLVELLRRMDRHKMRRTDGTT